MPFDIKLLFMNMLLGELFLIIFKFIIELILHTLSFPMV